MRTEPHSGLCELCSSPIIDARLGVTPSSEIRLDAAPDPDGSYTAFLDGFRDVWVARPWEEQGPFWGLRRRVHVCPDVQLSL